MANLVLYRKYRPKTFGEIIGQEHVVQTLTNAISSGMVSHAYLFSGPRGSGKTTMARLLAKALNCQNKKEGSAEPCNNCSSCIEINEGRSIDLMEIDAASNRGIDDIRELREGIRFSPAKSKYKIFIVDEAHQLSKDAANALLKTLEEPPAHAIFVLATTEIHKMIPTILSRCQRFDFRKLTVPEVISRLETIAQKEKTEVDKSVLELIALNSGGSARDAEGLLDQVLAFGAKTTEEIKDLLGMVDARLVGQFVECLGKKKSAEAIDFLNKTLEKGKDPQEFAKTLINYLRQGLIQKIAPDLTNPIMTGLTQEEQKTLQVQMANFSEQDLHRSLKLFLDAENKMKYSPIPQLPLELAIIESCGSATQYSGVV
jgi:DNA polymerase III subunit gamma/tau